eukprot:scaffold41507_cov214-Amphora_coffeaeformis.AAC.1
MLSTLHSGAGLLQVSKGVDLIPQYDEWRKQMAAPNNPENIDSLALQYNTGTPITIVPHGLSAPIKTIQVI